jgi:hypothetical protein
MSQSASDMLDLYIQAEKDVLEGKSTTMNGRTMSMENLQEIRDGRKEWERRVLRAASVAAGRKPGRPALAKF